MTSRAMMTNEQYDQTQKALLEHARAISGLDLRGFLERLAEAEAIAPALDPTLHRQTAATLAGIMRLANAALSLAYELERLREAALDAVLQEERHCAPAASAGQPGEALPCPECGRPVVIRRRDCPACGASGGVGLP